MDQIFLFKKKRKDFSKCKLRLSVHSVAESQIYSIESLSNLSVSLSISYQKLIIITKRIKENNRGRDAPWVQSLSHRVLTSFFSIISLGHLLTFVKEHLQLSAIPSPNDGLSNASPNSEVRGSLFSLVPASTPTPCQ